MGRSIRFACLLLLGNVSVADEKAKLPPKTEREQAGKQLREIFKSDFAKTTSAAKLELANKLFQQVEASKDEPATQFMLLKEAAELAAWSNMDLALQGCEKIVARFDGDFIEMLEPTMKFIISKVNSVDDGLVATSRVLKFADDFVLANDFDGALRFNKMASSAAYYAKNDSLSKQVSVQAREIDLGKQLFAKLPPAQKALESNPNDAEACLIVGTFSALVDGDWGTGLPLLAKCSDKKFKALAEKDLEAKEDSPTALVDIADAWYDLAKNLEGYPKRQIYLRILRLDQHTLPLVAGLNKKVLEKRIEELEKSVLVKSELSEFFAMIRLQHSKATKLDPRGGYWENKAFSEQFANNGVLIGFTYTQRRFSNGTDYFDAFQPIYLTANGEKKGTVIGDFGKAKQTTVKAPPGYAIGKMAIQAGGLWDGANLTFMKITAKGLNPDDTQESGWISKPGQPGIMLGDGRPIVGIHGKTMQTAHGTGICTIGFTVVSEKLEPKKK